MDAVVRRTSAGVLGWSPAKDPTKAVMLNPDRWTQLASWTKGAAKQKSPLKPKKNEDDQ